MQSLDLNLLVALDALLREGSVTRAAERMHLSAPAMSRTLARIREATGDPILVRAGRGLVATPRAQAMRARVRALVEEAGALFQAGAPRDPGAFVRTFAIRADDAVAVVLGPDLLARLADQAPGVTLRLVSEGDEDVASLREGTVDLDIGVQGPLGPEVRVQTLFTEGLVAIARRGAPLARGRLTVARFAAAEHVLASRRGRTRGPLDDALAALGLERRVRAVAPTNLAAAALVARTDALATVSASFARGVADLLGLRVLPLPLPWPPIAIAQAWHPRFDHDPVHAWMRARIREIASAHVGRKSRA